MAEDRNEQLAWRDVEIQTPDGVCDAAFIHPKTGAPIRAC